MKKLATLAIAAALVFSPTAASAGTGFVVKNSGVTNVLTIPLWGSSFSVPLGAGRSTTTQGIRTRAGWCSDIDLITPRGPVDLAFINGGYGGRDYKLPRGPVSVKSWDC